MSNKRFIKTKSNYTLKKKVLSTDMGSIYERDYMTINNEGSNFKFTNNTSPAYRKKHSLFDEGETDALSYKNNIFSQESKIKVKPDFESLKNFAFYGSSKELIRVSVENIILNFPAEATFLSGGKLKNPFGIDFFSSKIERSEVYNRLRFMSASWKRYVMIVGDKEYRIDDWKCWADINESEDKMCPNLKDVFYCEIIFNEKAVHLTKYFDFEKQEWKTTHDFDDSTVSEIRMRPDNDTIIEELGQMSEFENILLNQYSKPKYTAIFYSPYETDSGIGLYRNSYTWPSSDGYNPDIDTSLFKDYYSSLISLAEFYDQYYTDNIWETMVHDSIKNTDYSFIRRINGETETNGLDSSKLRPIIEAWGYQFDFLKRQIDGIGCTNRITYNEKNNAPDYTLKSKLNLSGWDVKQTNPTHLNDVRTAPLFPSMAIGSTSIDANSQFFKELYLNTKYIFPRKGTKEAIKAVMGLFGIDERDYIINEFISVARPKEGKTYPDYNYVEHFNRSYEKIEQDDGLNWLPLKKVDLIDGNETKSYVIPWFNNGEEYYGNAYFQMKGGWDEKESKYVKNPFTGKIVLLKKEDGLGLYEETTPILKIFNDINSISFGFKGFLKPKEVMYMTDIEGLDLVYKNEFGERYNIDQFSHYFVLENKNCGYTLGYDEINQVYGWKNVLLDEFNDENLSLNAKRVLYMESLKEISEGNNPHAGYYEYDSGKEYMDMFRNVFKNADLNYLSDEDAEKAMEIGFYVDDRVVDNKKVWYFDDTLSEKESDILVSGVTEGIPDTDPWGRKENVVDDVKEIRPFNPEGVEANDEAAANSIINNKFLQIVFFTPLFKKDENMQYVQEFRKDMKKYMNDVVFFYVKQVIPSTTIVRFSIIDRKYAEMEEYCYDSELDAPYFRPPINGTVITDDISEHMVIPVDETIDEQHSVRILNITDGIKIQEKEGDK